MRYRFLLSALAVFFFVASGQAQDQPGKRVQAVHGTPAIIRLDPKKQRLATGQSQKILADNLGMRSHDKLQMLSASNDRAGYHHQKFQQFYKGLKVEYGVYTVHARNSVVESISGEYYQVPELSVKPALAESEAFQKALQALQTTQTHRKTDGPQRSSANGSGGSHKGELLVCPKVLQRKNGEAVEMALAYKFDIYISQPPSRTLIYVDAHTGEIILKNQLIKHADGMAATRYSGSRQIQTHAQPGGGFILKDATRGAEIHTYNMRRRINYAMATEFTDADNYWSSSEYDNPSKDNAALDAHWGAMMTYDYFLQEHGRNSFDDQGGAIRNYVHYDMGYENAFWDGSRMTYGDGADRFDALTSLDIVAHEIGHAVCQHTADLIYYGEAGALNEGLSDIWAANVEHFAAPDKSNWLIGEEVIRQGHAMRSMSDPNANGQPDTYQGRYWNTGDDDHGGVHTNSGVINHWYYLLSIGKGGTNDNGDPYNVTGIGMDKAADIVYLTESAYLTANSGYSNAREFSIQAATDLYGANSNEVAQTIRAWNAVGVYETIAAPSNFQATVASATSVALQWHDNSTDETGFKIERSSAGGEFEQVARVGPNTTSYTDSGLPQHALFYYRVRTARQDGLSPASNEAMVILGNPPPTVPTKDSLALVALFNKTDGPGWTKKNNWLSTQVNRWYGVTVENGRVTHLRLSNNNLHGELPPELAECTALKTLDISNGWFADNVLTGNIPPGLGNLTDLQQLILSGNDLGGTIPSAIGNLTSLKVLYLFSNRISGRIPPELGRLGALEDLRLWDNDLSGSIPPELGQLTALRVLDLEANELTGEIPETLGNLLHLEELWLNVNQLQGEIPDAFRNLTALQYMFLWDNQLTGNIPAFFGNMVQLKVLVLSHNQLTGAIPNELANLNDLSRLDLSINQLTGSIPEDLGNLSFLVELNLGENKLTGQIPGLLANLPDLYHLGLHHNELTGSIPPGLGSLASLEYLRLNNNRLTGEIPASLGELAMLYELDLGSNQLTGNIPPALANLTGLRVLSLDDNQFTGSPESLSALKLSALDLTKNQFTGLPDFLSNTLVLQAGYNKLTFESLEINFDRFYNNVNRYKPQDSVGIASRLTLHEGESFVMSAFMGGVHNHYQWTNNGVDIPGAVNPTLAVSSPGRYSCKITNTLVTGLTLHRRNIFIKRSQSIHFPAIAPRVYGDPQFSVVATASSGYGVTLKSSDPAVALVSGNVITIVGAGATTIQACQAGDGEYAAASPVQQTLVVNKAQLTVAADNKSRAYGSANPELTISFAGFYHGDNIDDITAPSVSVTTTESSNAGMYPIVLSGGSAQNYELALQHGWLTITQVTLTVTTHDKSKIYGEPNPEFTLHCTGFVNGDDMDDITPPVASVTATTNSGVGQYPITLSGGSATNYLFTFQDNAYLTIDRARLTVTADNKSKIYGAANPEFTISYSGFVNGDDINDITPPVASVTGSTTDAGPYTIGLQGGSAANYWLELKHGLLNILKADQIITFNAIPAQTFGDERFSLQATASSGLPVTFESSETAKATVVEGKVILLKPGLVTITAKQPGDSRYHAASEVSRTFCVNPAKPVITIDLANPQAPLLTSSASEGNRWYKNGTALTGAFGATLIVPESGYYTVTTSADHCTSVFSDEASIIITGVMPLEANLITLYPNPVHQQLQIIFTNGSRKEIDVIHLNGTIVLHAATADLNASLDVADLAPGVYAVKIRTAEGIKSLKFIKR